MRSFQEAASAPSKRSSRLGEVLIHAGRADIENIVEKRPHPVLSGIANHRRLLDPECFGARHAKIDQSLVLSVPTEIS
jgi:hypothetical protein